MMPSIATKFQYVNSPPLFLYFSFLLTAGHPQVRYTIDDSKDYSYYNGSVVRTQLNVCLYWYSDPWSPIHVIKLSTKVVKTLIFTVKLVSYIKMLKFKVSRQLYPLMMVWAVLHSFWPASRSASCRQWSSFFLRLLLFSSLLFGWYVVLCWRCECLTLGWDLIHLVRRKLLAYFTSPRWRMMDDDSVVQSVEWLPWETELFGEGMPQCHFAHHKSHMSWPRLEPGPPQWVASD
jgi:hypothetical protein